MIDSGAFDGVDLALMAHPYPIDVSLPIKFAMEMYEIFRFDLTLIILYLILNFSSHGNYQFV